MRVGLPSEASSCRWSARGPQDWPERRRSGLAHVVRVQLSFILFKETGTFHVFAEGGGTSNGANLAATSCLSPFIFTLQLEKCAQRQQETFPKFLWCFKSGRWPANYEAGRGRSGAREEELRPLTAAPGP